MKNSEPKFSASEIVRLTLFSLGLGILSFFVFAFTVTFIAICMRSPEVDSITGEPQPTMPLGEVFFGFMIGFLAGLITWIISFRYFQRKMKAHKQ